VDEHTAVERRDGFCDAKRVNQHFHAEWRAAAGNCEFDACMPKAFHCFY
jgi:hypothetical protein